MSAITQTKENLPGFYCYATKQNLDALLSLGLVPKDDFSAAETKHGSYLGRDQENLYLLEFSRGVEAHLRELGLFMSLNDGIFMKSEKEEMQKLCG